MILADAIEIKVPAPDSQFRLVPCKACGDERAAYVRYRAGGIEPWRVQCLGCGHSVDKAAAVRHDAQVAWNWEDVA